MAFYEIEPFGEERADLRAGIVASTIVNAATHGRAGSTPRDFMPTFGKKRQSIAEMQDILMSVSRQAEAAKRAKDRKAPPAKKRGK